MKSLALIAAALLLTGCGREEAYYEYMPATDAERLAVRNMTEQLCQNSNPHSDEEPEDMIAKAHEVACRTICPPRLWVRHTQTWHERPFTEQDSHLLDPRTGAPR